MNSFGRNDPKKIVKLSIFLGSIVVVLLLLFCITIIFINEKRSNFRSEVDYDVLKSIRGVSSFSLDEYTCTGACFCEEEVGRRNSLTVGKSFIHVVAAVSSIVAFKLATEDFSNKCHEELTSCDESAIHSEVYDCSEVQIMDEAPTNSKFKDISDEAFRKSKFGTVKAISTSETKGVVKNPVEEAYFKVEHGIVGDAHAGSWHRQVSLLASESADKVRNAAPELDITDGRFAENITTEGLEICTLPIGTKLKIGETIQQVTQIGKECHTGCAIKKLVGDCVMPREGIFTRVLVGGTIRTGDSIEVLD